MTNISKLSSIINFINTELAPSMSMVKCATVNGNAHHAYLSLNMLLNDEQKAAIKKYYNANVAKEDVVDIGMLLAYDIDYNDELGFAKWTADIAINGIAIPEWTIKEYAEKDRSVCQSANWLCAAFINALDILVK